jgi:hypothetical protein
MLKTKFGSRVRFLGALCFFLTVVLGCKLLGGLPKTGNLFEGNAIPDAIGQLKKKVGGPVKALSVEIKSDELTLEAQDPKNPAHVDSYRYSKGLVSGPTPVNLSKLIDSDVEHNVFDLDEISFDAVPALVKASIEKTGLEGGKVSEMHLGRGLILDKGLSMGAPQWNIHVGGPRGDATVYANGKGEIVKVNKL